MQLKDSYVPLTCQIYEKLLVIGSVAEVSHF